MNKTDQQLDSAFAELDWQVQPRHDLWPAIERRLTFDENDDARLSFGLSGEGSRKVTPIHKRINIRHSWMPLAISACLILTVCSVFFNVIAFQKLNAIQSLQFSQYQEGAATRNGDDRNERPMLHAKSQGSTVDYSIAIDVPPSIVRTQIMRIIQQDRDTLDPTIVVEVQQALTVIDLVYKDIARSLKDEPGNTELTRLLMEIYEQEVQLLDTLRLSGGMSI